MKIKKLLLCTAAVCMSLASAVAQTIEPVKGSAVSKTDDRVEFAPYWFIQFEDGITHTSGDYYTVVQVLSPEFKLGGGYMFSPIFALRANFGYGENRNYANYGGNRGKGYSAEFYQAQGDAMINICNLIGGFKHQRTINIFPFIGVGGNLGTQNLSYGESDYPDAWKATKFFPSARTGVHFDIRITNHVSAIIEGDYNIYSDKFNSKLKPANGECGIDRQQNILAGLKFRMGDGYRPSAGYLAAQAAAKEAAIAAERAAAEKAAAEAEAARLAAEKAAREKAEAERIAAEKAAAEAAAAEKEAIHKQRCIEHTCDIFFHLDRANITKKEMPKLEELAKFLKENEGFLVNLCGYADRQTGNPNYNMALSDRRVKSIKKALISLGVPEARILTDHKGDTEQPYDVQEKNRLVTCRVK